MGAAAASNRTFGRMCAESPDFAHFSVSDCTEQSLGVMGVGKEIGRHSAGSRRFY